ncbi:hypothetical protein DH2020_039562 [Rehmannia glutinosa]|uniref:CCHC-type domain-containing protein n=1 Tax=Rehmannia glutinosa TaxID=99300 RepID=A0ABR0UWM6_REHGL
MDTDLSLRLRSFSLTSKESEDIALDEKDIVKSRAECEKSLVRDGKTWSFDSQYLILREWSKNIMDDMENFKTIDLWVQLWGIPCHWTSIEIGMKIGTKFKSVKDIIIPETGSSVGRHIKILVEVDLEKPLMRGTNLKLDGETYWISFKYENFQSFCFTCGLIGHTERSCQNRKEDLGRNSLKEGQFGDWMRAMDFGVFRYGQRSPKNTASTTIGEPSGSNEIIRNEVEGVKNQNHVLGKVLEKEVGVEAEKFQGGHPSSVLRNMDNLPNMKVMEVRRTTLEINTKGQAKTKEDNKENERSSELDTHKKDEKREYGNRIPLKERHEGNQNGCENHKLEEKVEERKVFKKYSGKKIQS